MIMKLIWTNLKNFYEARPKNDPKFGPENGPEKAAKANPKGTTKWGPEGPKSARGAPSRGVPPPRVGPLGGPEAPRSPPKPPEASGPGTYFFCKYTPTYARRRPKKKSSPG